jgi:hypothetical protein
VRGCVHIHVIPHSPRLVHLRVGGCCGDVGTSERRCTFHDSMYPRLNDQSRVVLDLRVSAMIVKGDTVRTVEFMLSSG